MVETDPNLNVNKSFKWQPRAAARAQRSGSDTYAPLVRCTLYSVLFTVQSVQSVHWQAMRNAALGLRIGNQGGMQSHFRLNLLYYLYNINYYFQRVVSVIK